MALGYQIKHRSCNGQIRSILFPTCLKCGRKWGTWKGLWASDFYWVKIRKRQEQSKGKGISRRPVTGVQRIVFWGLVALLCVGMYFLGVWIVSVAG